MALPTTNKATARKASEEDQLEYLSEANGASNRETALSKLAYISTAGKKIEQKA